MAGGVCASKQQQQRARRWVERIAVVPAEVNNRGETTMPIYCHSEGARFPETEFARDDSGNLMVPFIHNTSEPHYANAGIFKRHGSDPGTLSVLERIHEHMLSKSPAELKVALARLEKNAK